MKDFIGKYIRKYLRANNISNAQAGGFIGLSESAFEKVLMKDDISVNRLLKLSKHTNENFLEYYYDQEPLVSFRQNKFDELLQKIAHLEQSMEQLSKAIADKDKIIEYQDKLIAELEEKQKL